MAKQRLYLQSSQHQCFAAGQTPLLAELFFWQCNNFILTKTITKYIVHSHQGVGIDSTTPGNVIRECLGMCIAPRQDEVNEPIVLILVPVVHQKHRQFQFLSGIAHRRFNPLLPLSPILRKQLLAKSQISKSIRRYSK